MTTSPVSATSLQPRAYPVSWEELHRDARALSWRLVGRGPFTGIVAVTRGGMVPAAIVARELDIRLIDTVCVSSYDHQALRDSAVLKTASGAGDGAGWLLIDDLVDTGRTAGIIRQMLPKAHFATIYAKPAGQPLVDTFMTEVSQDTWIYFPWDVAPQFAEPIVDQHRPSHG